MDVVYAMASGHVGGPDGLMLFVRMGTHWPASDPVVLANPAVFSPDPRYGLCTTAAANFDDPAPPAPQVEVSGRRKAVPA